MPIEYIRVVVMLGIASAIGAVSFILLLIGIYTENFNTAKQIVEYSRMAAMMSVGFTIGNFATELVRILT